MAKLKELAKKQVQNAKGFENKTWNILIILWLTLTAFSIQAFVEAKFNPDIVKANISGHDSMAQEAFKLSSDFAIKPIYSEKGGYYIAPGETDVPIFALSIESYKDILLFERLQLTLQGEVDEKMFVVAKLFEGENKIATSRIKEGVFSFKNFTSILKPGVNKEYTIKLDISPEAQAGARFNFEITNPYAITLNSKNIPQYSLDRYPIVGDYVTIVGWRKK
ncbi:hypothetical protein C0416_02135 [bacterium]|nr:hypothetical protein [bacterium]